MTASETKSTPAASKASSTEQKKAAAPTFLPETYSPGSKTVIVGRGKKVKRHAGNRNLTALVRSELAEYSQAEKTAKSFILMRVLKRVRDSNPDKIGFVKQDPKTERWMSLPVSHARICVAQEFRDALPLNYRSSKHCKQRRRMREKGYDDMPSDTDEKSCATKHAEDNFNLLSGLAKGFKHRRAQCQNQMRKLIHVPARECPEVACSRRVSFVQGEMMPQGHPYYGYGYGHDPLYSDGYTASQLGGSISTPDMAMFPPTYPRMRMMAQQQPTVYHYNSFIPVESLPALQEATAPAAANIENEDLFNYPLDGDLFATEGDPFATSDDEDIEDVTPLDLKVFHEVPLSDVQKALHINPNV